MIRKVIKTIALCVGIFLLVNSTVAIASDSASDLPCSNGGKPWQIAYYEGGEFYDYRNNLLGVVNGLKSLGWISLPPYPQWKTETSKEVWDWLAQQHLGQYVTIKTENFYSPQWNEDKRVSEYQRYTDNVEKGLVDIVVGLGTWAGVDLSQGKVTIPMVIGATANPIQSGIIQSITDSGKDHVFARIAPNRFTRQLEVFHDLVEFEVLGIAYPDTQEGRTYAALEDVRAVCQQRNIQLMECHTQDVTDLAVAEQSVLKCFEELAASGAQSIYVTIQRGINAQSIEPLAQLAHQHQLTTFSQNGQSEVRAGLLMSISFDGYSYVGQFYASTIGSILNGAKPRSLPQVFEDPKQIELNIETAKRVGYHPPIDALLAADVIYESIEE